ncbi:hypothetical protein ACFX13_036724 [Malus domestica]
MTKYRRWSRRSHSSTLTTARGAFSGSISIFPRVWNPLLGSRSLPLSHSIGAPLLRFDNSDDMIQLLVAVLEAGSTKARKQAAMEIRLLAKNKSENRLKIARNVKPLISLLLSYDL